MVLGGCLDVWIDIDLAFLCVEIAVSGVMLASARAHSLTLASCSQKSNPAPAESPRTTQVFAMTPSTSTWEFATIHRLPKIFTTGFRALKKEESLFLLITLVVLLVT